jgi:hypothetical protein
MRCVGDDDDEDDDAEPDDEPAVIRDPTNSAKDLMDNKLAANPPNTGFAEGPL